MPKIIGERQNHFKDSYTAYLGEDNSATGLVRGRDFLRSGTIDEAAFPAKAIFDHAFPAQPANSVYGFNHISFGDTRGTRPPRPIIAKPVSEIATLRHAFEMSTSGYTNGFNVIVDMFLTKAANVFTNPTEVMIFLQSSEQALAWLNTGSVVAGYVDKARRVWKIVQFPGSFCFVPDASVLVDDLDLKEMIQFLVFKKLVTGSDFYNGHSIGSEPVLFGGRLSIGNVFNVTYS